MNEENVEQQKLTPEEFSELTETHNNVSHASAALEQAHNALLRAQGAADHVVNKLARKYGLPVPFQVAPDGTLPSKAVATP